MEYSKYSWITILLILLLLLTGCSAKNPFGSGDKKETKDPTVVFTFGSEDVTKGEVYIYVNSVKERYEICYGVQVWDKTTAELASSSDASEEDDPSIEELTRENIVNEIVKVKTLVSKKDSYDVEISDTEAEELMTRARSFYEGLNDNDKAVMEITEDMAYQVLYENAIAGKVMNKLMEDESLEISDEEARMTTFYDMSFVCYSKDANGNIVPFTEEERIKQYSNALQACGMLATAEIDNNEDAESIDKLAAYYNLEEAREYTLTPEEILSIYGEDIYNSLYMMNNGDYSTVIESEYGYHVFQMIALTDQKATAINKEIIKKQRTDALLFDTIEAWRTSIDKKFTYPDSVNMDVYNTIKISD